MCVDASSQSDESCNPPKHLTSLALAAETSHDRWQAFIPSLKDVNQFVLL
jgi:hypothetical protein